MPILAGAHATVITPSTTQFLDGYPHVRRFSTGVDTDLYSSALYLKNGDTAWLTIGLDLIFVEKKMAREIRQAISAETGLPTENILVAATHTHSGPVSRHSAPFSKDDPDRQPDWEYLNWVASQTIASGVAAIRNAVSAEIGRGFGSSAEVGGNRRDPKGASNPKVPVLFLRSVEDNRPIGLLQICSMHPTVLHQDSTLVSGDFPGHARLRIQEKFPGMPVIHLTGAAGNQSPRHFARANTVEEARRLGHLLADTILDAVDGMSFSSEAELSVAVREVTLPFNEFPTVEAAVIREREVRARFERMRDAGEDPRATRTAETDWFGAERLLKLAKLHEAGEIESAAREYVLPAELQLLQMGDWTFAAWPGEVFVEFALELMVDYPGLAVITYSNGTLQGYLVTEEAVKEGGYEASAASFKSPESPRILVTATREMLDSLPAKA